MKKMIRMTAMVAAMFVAVSTVAKAQDPAQQGRGRGGAGARIMAVLDSVKASADVKAKADSIIKATAALNAPLMEAARGGDADARGKMQANNQKQTEAIKALLTAEQKEQYDKVMAAMPQGRGRPPAR
jgi:ABC-type Na+ efflux pump permease subunit